MFILKRTLHYGLFIQAELPNIICLLFANDVANFGNTETYNFSYIQSDYHARRHASAARCEISSAINYIYLLMSHMCTHKLNTITIKDNH